MAGTDYVTDAQLAALSAAVSASLVALRNSVPELARDAIGTALVQGSGVTITVDDTGNTITLAATGGAGGGLTAQQAAAYSWIGV